jgi:RND family efflux transporter MFP subunit
MITERPTESSTPRESLPANPAPTKVAAPWVLLTLGALALGAALVLGTLPKFKMGAARARAQASASGPRAVHVTPARLKDGPSRVVLPGSVVPWETAEIYSRTDGFVRQYFADIGDFVKAGTVLAVIDAPEIESEAKSAAARARESEQNEILSKTRADRYKRLAEAGVNSKEQADQYAVQANSATSAVDTSRAEVNRINTLLGFRVVKAPFDGVITARNVDKGTLVTAGSSAGVTSLFQVSRVERLRVLVDVPQVLASSVRVGEPATVILGQKAVQGRVERTAGALDPKTRTLRAEVTIAGDQGILAGSFVRVSLEAKTSQPPVLVPANALVPGAEGTFVFIVDAHGKLARISVEMGRELGVDAEIVKGLQGGEAVVKSPPESLAVGEPVRVVVDQPAGAKP